MEILLGVLMMEMLLIYYHLLQNKLLMKLLLYDFDTNIDFTGCSDTVTPL